MKTHNRQIIATILTGITVALVGFLLAMVLLPQFSGGEIWAIDDPEISISTSEILNEQQRVFASIYNAASPSVVAITNQIQGSEGGSFQSVSSGSGFVIDAQGHIVSNYHVVSGADRLVVSMFDGTITEAEIIGEDPDSDLAVIRVDVSSDRLVPIPFGDSSLLEVGQTVLAIGSPFQNDWTLTSGIISALNRRIIGLNSYSIGGVIQTDTAINPGNSGGPLLNLNGEVIGVNSQIESRTRSNSGVGFAIPSNLVAKVSRTLIENGRMEYSFIGIAMMEIDLDVIRRYDLPDNIRGVAVREVRPNTPAAASGLHSLTQDSIDVITAVDGHPVVDFDEMIGYLAMNTNPGDTVMLTIYRDRQVFQLPVTLTSR